MPKTTREYWQSILVRTTTGDEDISFLQGREWPGALPPRLRDPFLVDVETYYGKLMDAPDEAARAQVEDDLASKLKSEMRERLELAFQYFGGKDRSAESWKHVAHTVLRQFVPGLSVGFDYLADPKPTLMTEGHVKAVVEHVDQVFAQLRAGRSNKSPKVPRRKALRQVYKHWPGHLGRKRKTFEAWETHYHRCKQEHLRLSLSRLLQSPPK